MVICAVVTYIFEITMQRIINVWLLKLVVVKLAYVIKVRVLQQQN